MTPELLWVSVAAFAFAASQVTSQFVPDAFAEGSSSSSSESASLFDAFDAEDEEYVLVRNMIDESRSIVSRILRAKLPDEVDAEVKRNQPKLIRFFRGVSKQTRKCLRKYGTQRERVRNAGKCFAEAVRTRQSEDGSAPSSVQDCLQTTMMEAATEAAPLMADAQELGQRFRTLMRETGQKVMECREEVRPFECVRSAWTEAAVDMMGMREEAIEMMTRARDLYNKYKDSMQFCMTPVEAPDEEEGEEEYDEEKKDQGQTTTEASKCVNEYDSVQSDTATRSPAINACDEKPTL